MRVETNYCRLSTISDIRDEEAAWVRQSSLRRGTLGEVLEDTEGPRGCDDDLRSPDIKREERKKEYESDLRSICHVLDAKAMKRGCRI